MQRHQDTAKQPFSLIIDFHDCHRQNLGPSSQCGFLWLENPTTALCFAFFFFLLVI